MLSVSDANSGSGKQIFVGTGPLAFENSVVARLWPFVNI